jgi:hypothetical protein
VIPEGLRVAIVTNRAPDGIPTGKLPAGAALTADRVFIHGLLTVCAGDLSVRVAKHWAFFAGDQRVRGSGHTGASEGAVVAIDVQDGVCAEVNGIRTEDPGAAEDIGVIDLKRERFPAAGGVRERTSGIMRKCASRYGMSSCVSASP